MLKRLYHQTHLTTSRQSPSVVNLKYSSDTLSLQSSSGDRLSSSSSSICLLYLSKCFWSVGSSGRSNCLIPLGPNSKWAPRADGNTKWLNTVKLFCWIFYRIIVIEAYHKIVCTLNCNILLAQSFKASKKSVCITGTYQSQIIS